jgi:NADH-quinone oxidoreductase subunit J
MLNIYYLFSILQVFTASFLFFSNNPIHSILFLILLFFESTVILSFLNLEFVSLLFILVYVGAIAVLFLFVIMMLRVKLDEFDVLLFLPINFALNSYLIIYMFSYIQPFTYLPGIFYSSDFICFENCEENLNELFIIGQVLYNFGIVLVVIAGLVLLLGLVGSVILSLDFKKLRLNNAVFRRLSRTSNFVSFFK